MTDPPSWTPLLDNVTVRRGSFVLQCEHWSTKSGLTAVVGLNGAGKSTLLNALAGQLVVSSGSAEHVGGFSILPQGASLTANFTVRQLFEYIAALRGVGRAARRAEVDRVLEDCHLTSRADQKLASLSGGWRQRCLVGQCLLGAPPGILLDEPTVSLDVAASRQCWELLKHVSAGIPVVIATHEASAAVEYADHVVTVDDGVVSTAVSGESIRQRYSTYQGSVESFLLSVLVKSGAAE